MRVVPHMLSTCMHNLQPYNVSHCMPITLVILLTFHVHHHSLCVATAIHLLLPKYTLTPTSQCWHCAQMWSASYFAIYVQPNIVMTGWSHSHSHLSTSLALYIVNVDRATLSHGLGCATISRYKIQFAVVSSLALAVGSLPTHSGNNS